MNDETTRTGTPESGQPGQQQPPPGGPGAAQPPPAPEKTPQQEIEEAKVVAALGYLWILCIIPLITPPNNRFAKFHGRQGLALFIGWIVVWVVAIVLGIILGQITILGPIISLLLWVGLELALLVLVIMGIVKAASGEYWKMPIFGDFAEKMKI